MTKVRSTSILLQDILLSCELIYAYTKGLTYQEFLESMQTKDSVSRRVEIIGEIVKTLPMVLRNEHPKIPWKSISWMRDILVHEYYRVDPALTWHVCQIEIPKLERQIRKIKKAIDVG